MSFEDGTISGKSWFDPELGMLVESAFDMNMNVRPAMSAQEPSANTDARSPATAIPLNQKINLKLVDVNQAAK